MAEHVTVAEANTYFNLRPNSTGWDNLPDSGDDKEAYLTFAENLLDAAYVLDGDNASHKRAIYEQALFEANNPTGADARRGLHTMGVEEAGIVEEKYREGADPLAICPYAKRVLASVERAPGSSWIGSHLLVRDEDDRTS